MMKEKEISLLIEKFFNGDTSLSEERWLYQYFKSSNLPDSLKQYRPLFCDIALLQISKDKPVRRNLIRWIAGVAASVALFMCGYITWNSYNQNRMLRERYAGSYIILNGKRIDNLKEIQPYIEKTLSDARQIEHIAATQPSASDIEQDLLDNISDPKEKARIKQLLD